MKKALFWLLASAIVASVVASVFAGGHACEVSTDDCIKKMHAKYQQSGWLGIEKEKGEDGTVRISAVTPGGPAAAAGFAVGDILVAINGVALSESNTEKWKKVKMSMSPGSRVNYTVSRRGANLDLTVTLEKPSESVIAEWIADHVAKEHVPQTVASK